MDVIKRGGTRPSEVFDQAKLHHSVRAAVLSVRSPEGEAETVATHVSGIVKEWCASRAAVTSHDLRRVAASALEAFHPEAAYLYQNHQLIL